MKYSKVPAKPSAKVPSRAKVPAKVSAKVPSRAKPSAKVPTKVPAKPSAKVPRKKYNKIGGQRSSNGSSTARSSTARSSTITRPVLARDVKTIIPIIAKDLGKFEKASAPISKYAKKYDSLNTSRSRE